MNDHNSHLKRFEISGIFFKEMKIPGKYIHVIWIPYARFHWAKIMYFEWSFDFLVVKSKIFAII